MNTERYLECLEDIKVAKNELKKIKLYPKSIIMDLYCIPAHNYPTYYITISKKGDGYQLVYVKAHIFLGEEMPVKMHSFADCKKVEDGNFKNGRFIMGIKNISTKLVKAIENIMQEVPDGINLSGDTCIDGVFQAIRLYDGTKKELYYHNYDNSEIKELSEQQVEFLNRLYMELAKIIE